MFYRVINDLPFHLNDWHGVLCACLNLTVISDTYQTDHNWLQSECIENALQHISTNGSDILEGLNGDFHQRIKFKSKRNPELEFINIILYIYDIPRFI